MKYTLRNVIQSLPSEKKKEDSVLGIIFSRPLSYLFTYLFINIGCSAWLISLLSVIVGLSGCVLLFFDNTLCIWIGIGLILFWTILDCVDGNIARLRNTQGPKGEFMDALSGYFVCAFIFLGLGVLAFRNTSLFKSNLMFPLLFGAIASIYDILSRLIYQKYKFSCLKVTNSSNNKEHEGLFKKLKKFVSVQFGVAGLLPVCLVVGQIWNSLFDYILLFYLALNALALIAVSSIYSLKARK